MKGKRKSDVCFSVCWAQFRSCLAQLTLCCSPLLSTWTLLCTLDLHAEKQSGFIPCHPSITDIWSIVDSSKEVNFLLAYPVSICSKPPSQQHCNLFQSNCVQVMGSQEDNANFVTLFRRILRQLRKFMQYSSYSPPSQPVTRGSLE